MVFGATIFLPKLRCLPLSTRPRRLVSRIGGDHAQEAVQIAVVEDVAFAHQRAVVGKDVGSARDARVFAFNFETIIEQARADIQPAFDQPNILVASPEQGLNAAADLYAGFHSRKNKVGLFTPGIR